MPPQRAGHVTKPPCAKNKTSCTECQRRKQGCSGTWPCVHCSKRNIARNCHFGLSDLAKNSLVGLEGKSLEINPFTPSNALSQDDHSSNREDDVDLPDPKILGYADGYEHFSLEQSLKLCQKLPVKQNFKLTDELQAALRTLPSRSLVDELVHRYSHDINNIYSTIHMDTFLKDYSDWYEARMQDLPVSPAFTCLLLQVCASAAQGPTEALQRQIVYDLAENGRNISKRLHNAAEALSSTLKPGTGDVHQVLRFLLAAAWSKSEGLIIEAWHYVGAAVREEQECGMDRDAPLAGLAEIDVEIRTRIWCYTVLWDWQMGEWLSREMLINVTNYGIRTPNLLLDAGADGSPSPFANTFHQYKLVHTLSSRFGRLNACISLGSALNIHETIERWMLELPAELSDPDSFSHWDKLYPWIPKQRAQLHSFAEMVRLTPLKKHLLRSADSEKDEGDHIRDLASHTSIRCIEAALRLHDCVSILQYKFHFVIFALADTAAMICSSMLHDPETGIPHRSELLQAVLSASRALQDIAKVNESASTANKFVQSLLSRLPLLPSNHRIVENPSQWSDPTVASSEGLNVTNLQPTLGTLSPWSSSPHLDCNASNPSFLPEELDTALSGLDDFMDPKFTFEELLDISLEGV